VPYFLVFTRKAYRALRNEPVGIEKACIFVLPKPTIARVHRSGGEWLLIMASELDLFITCIANNRSGGSNPPERKII
jgi:hypothetical protein